MNFNWKLLGVVTSVAAAGISILSSAVDKRQQQEEIKAEVERQLAERKENEES